MYARQEQNNKKIFINNKIFLKTYLYRDINTITQTKTKFYHEKNEIDNMDCDKRIYLSAEIS